MNVLLVGEGSACLRVLAALADTEHRVVAVMTSPPGKSARGLASVWHAAEKQGYLTWPAKWVKDPGLASRIRSEQVDILLNVFSLFVIHHEVLQAVRVGCFNLHPGPLPRYAGLNSTSWAIYQGERTHGVTVHHMVPKIDAGAIAYQACFAINEQETGLSLTAKCIAQGVPLIIRLLQTAARDPHAIPRRSQDLTQRVYYGSDVPEGGHLSWDRPARQVVDFVRACDFAPFPSPWGHPRATLGGREVAVVKACRTRLACDMPAGSIGRTVNAGILVACADEWVLVNKLRVDGHSVSGAALMQ